MPSPPVREARAADLPRLRAIRAASLRETPPLLLDVAVRGVGLVLVATVSERPVGYALVMRDGESEVAYLAELAVAPDYRRRGYGSALLSAVLDRVAEHRELRLTARADDERARSFYEASGFERVEELPDHYADGDGVLYGRQL
ncbi:GNAT family N-acetyltransferase [Salinirubellus sp. GCM10025818]|uniref:GNAT family N-acetyltransferase n=1 Tax=Salinirubellus TaxID=2162630 RepID=UPI0030CD1819